MEPSGVWGLGGLFLEEIEFRGLALRAWGCKAVEFLRPPNTHKPKGPAVGAPPKSPLQVTLQSQDQDSDTSVLQLSVRVRLLTRFVSLP